MSIHDPSRTYALEVSPNGYWRRNRFDFCNALEAAFDEDDDKAWRLLERMGVTRQSADARNAMKARNEK